MKTLPSPSGVGGQKREPEEPAESFYSSNAICSVSVSSTSRPRVRDRLGGSRPRRACRRWSAPAPEGETSAQRSPESTSERADLVSFKLDDRSQAGITNVWLVWTIKNSSSKKSNYSWDWEAIDASGTRVANGTQLETDVQPGQTANGEFPTTLKSTKGVKLNITSFDRTAAS
ncbi:hypothetical protein [Streptomyces hydrogenans]|uniref:Uncharacterized protein n=1 Tax=Streptomyces hydrogenans TaxID=1873719 RepID=A0ABQ3PQF1_9ACTN|nr:hypothetical protein [Streptomyces hydrogenans]GHE25494.1 hypothetical protein GCM10018784_74180 [Streptomyces hydrogenans]GHI27241.1 hypothetical protein Shyd_86120 [Streptomyces hydrogenans]